MNCEQVEKMLLGTTERLSEADMQAVKAHLDECPECKAMFAAHTMLVNSVQPTSFSPTLEADLRQRVIARIKSETSESQRSATFVWLSSLIYRPAFAVICLVILILSAWAMLRIEPGKQTAVSHIIYASFPYAEGKFEVMADRQGYTAKEGRYTMKPDEILRSSLQHVCIFTFPEGQIVEAKGEFVVSMTSNQLLCKTGKGQLSFNSAAGTLQVMLPEFAISIQSAIIELTASTPLNRVEVIKGLVEIVHKDGRKQLLRDGEHFEVRITSHNEQKELESNTAKPESDKINENKNQPENSSATTSLEMQVPDSQPGQAGPASASSAEPVFNDAVGNLDNAF